MSAIDHGAPDVGAMREALAAVRRSGVVRAEIFAKIGRSRSYAWSSERESASLERREAGWLVRAGDDDRSFVFAASGPPRPLRTWPSAHPGGLRLPSPSTANDWPNPPWTPPPGLDLPLLGESEAWELFRAIDRELNRQLAGAGLIRARLDDGASGSRLLSSTGLEASSRARLAELHLEARGPGRPATMRELVQVDRAGRRFDAHRLAQRLADRLEIAQRGEAIARDRADVVLAPPVAAQLLAATSSLWLGAGVTEPSRVGMSALTVLDAPRLDGGLVSSAVDGEGLPTRDIPLIEAGQRQALLRPWWRPGNDLPTGCMWRSSWRTPPRPRPAQLIIEPQPTVRTGDLVAELARGYYLLEALGAVRVDGERFALEVEGFSLRRGEAPSALRGAWLCGTVSSLWRGVVAVARDLQFSPVAAGPAAGAIVGSPSLMVRGLELRAG
ncbi:MAG: metallopeptidase TldD-related protein [Acidobacteriota bacterium]